MRCDCRPTLGITFWKAGIAASHVPGCEKQVQLRQTSGASYCKAVTERCVLCRQCEGIACPEPIPAT